MLFSFLQSKYIHRRGSTLPELIVAVGITAGMMLAASMVFNAATGASGKAMANVKIAQQLNTITQQLNRDLSHLRSDMPFGIVFEEEPDFDGNPHRVDRLFFFTTGNFEVSSQDGRDQSKLAMVNYGQSYEGFENFDLDYVTPVRRIFCRREKMVAQSNDMSNLFYKMPLNEPMPLDLDDLTSLQYDTLPFLYMNNMLANQNIIENLTFINHFEDWYFKDDATSSTSSKDSFIRRPKMQDVFDYSDSGTSIRRLFMLPDVTDFQVDLWFESKNRWWPEEFDWSNAIFSTARAPFGFYWNVMGSPVKQVDSGNLPDPIFYIYPDSSYFVDGIRWWDEGSFMGAIPSPATWPSAIRFTFTLYDENRRHFPQGKTFSYIVKLPERQ